MNTVRAGLVCTYTQECLVGHQVALTLSCRVRSPVWICSVGESLGSAHHVVAITGASEEHLKHKKGGG